MPLSAVCVSTVTGRHRAWSSYSNLPAKNVQNLRTMNSTEELSTYRETKGIYSPTQKTGYFEYDFTDDKPVKKDKKWSFGNLFRRKKKTNDSSSDEELKKTSAEQKRLKEKKKKPVTFDHVVLTQPQVRSPGLYSNGPRGQVDNILSDTSKGSNRVPSDSAPKTVTCFQYRDIASRNNPPALSLDSINKRSRRELAKVRAEARRTSFNHNSSSDEDSQRSNSSHNFRSDESLSKLRDSSASRRSRAARTERYFKRHSRDGENPNNYLRISKSEAESSFLKLSDDSNRSPSASPSQLKVSYSSISSQSPSLIGLSTIPPSHINHNRFRVSNSTSNPSYKPPLSMNEYNNTAKINTSQLADNTFTNQRSISFDANIHRPQEESQVIHAKLELGKPRSGNFTLVDSSKLRQYYSIQQPPPPPPRDPRRLQSAQYLDTINQNNNSIFDISPVQLRYNYVKEPSGAQIRKLNSINLHPTFKSSSEDHIPREIPTTLTQRPSSATPESNNRCNLTRPEMRSRSDNYQYLTDKQPRSRKPIFIQNGINKSVSQKEIKAEAVLDTKGSRTFLDQLKARKSTRSSPQMFSCETKVQTQIFLPSVLPNNNPDDIVQGTIDVTAEKSPTEENLDVINQNTTSLENRESTQRKSSNLEEALNELEAIYNSLKLGDENLLEMAEKREEEVATQKILESRGQYPIWNSPRGTLSDSGFSYEPFDSLDNSRRKKHSRKSLKSDDMAFRKINREDRAATITDPQNVSAKISYLLASPIYSGDTPRTEEKTDPDEPDITLDDVVYRNIKQSNKLKVPEHPPPFGIPLGPITLAANSDYLHAVPEIETIKPSRIPDLVKDDLAYRNLRKDNTKEPVLPQVSADDLRNNNLNNPPTTTFDSLRMDLSELKKNRAVRSKSANIGSLISQEVIERASRRNARDKNVDTEYKTLTDIADAMQIAREVLRDKEKKITENKQASMSDTDAGGLKYTRYPALARKSLDKREDFISSHDSCSHNREKEMKSVAIEELNKPRKAQIVKEVTPDPVSSFEDTRLRHLFRTNSFEDALTALAMEAKEASDKFTQDLKDFDKKQALDGNLKDSSLKIKNDDKKVDSEIYSEPVNLCKKLLEAVVDSTQLMSPVNDAEGCKSNKDDPEMMESVASIIFSTNSRQKDIVESDHDYENLASDLEFKPLTEGRNCGKKSPFEKYKDQLITSFSELNMEVNNENEKLETNNEEHDYCNLGTDGDDGEYREKSPGETCVVVVKSNALNAISECACIEPFKVNYPQSSFEDVGSINPCDSDGESSGFHSQTSFPEHARVSSRDNLFKGSQAAKLGTCESLKSPKLVLETSKYNGCQSGNSDLERLHEGSGDVGFDRRHCSEMRHIPDRFKSASAWHDNPVTLAFACSYGIACFHQLASLDLFAVMGIIFAVLTFIAALFI